MASSKASLSKVSCSRGFKCLPQFTELGRPCEVPCKSRAQKWFFGSDLVLLNFDLRVNRGRNLSPKKSWVWIWG